MDDIEYEKRSHVLAKELVRTAWAHTDGVLAEDGAHVRITSTYAALCILLLEQYEGDRDEVERVLRATPWDTTLAVAESFQEDDKG